MDVPEQHAALVAQQRHKRAGARHTEQQEPTQSEGAQTQAGR